MLNHCSSDFKPMVTWYLYDIKGFMDRQLLLGKCPECKKDVALMIEVRIVDNKKFTQKFVGNPAKVVAEQNKNRVNYTSLDSKVKKCKVDFFKGICWGDNRMVKIGKEERYRAYQVGTYGARKLVTEVKVS